jgi:hypothetical protein
MHEDTSPPPAEDEPQYRTIEFADGLLIFDRKDTAGWVHSDLAVALTEAR